LRRVTRRPARDPAGACGQVTKPATGWLETRQREADSRQRGEESARFVARAATVLRKKSRRLNLSRERPREPACLTRKSKLTQDRKSTTENCSATRNRGIIVGKIWRIRAGKKHCKDSEKAHNFAVCFKLCSRPGQLVTSPQFVART
jgi:HSP90 family molecular chaperone